MKKRNRKPKEFNSLSNFVFEQQAKGKIVVATFDYEKIETKVIERTESDSFSDIKQAIKEVAGVLFCELQKRKVGKNIFAKIIFAKQCFGQCNDYNIVAKELKCSTSNVYYLLKQYDIEYRNSKKFRELADKVKEKLNDYEKE